MPKVFIVGGQVLYGRMFEERGFEVVDKVKDADLVQFTGGEDVCPTFYHHHTHPKTYYNLLRDKREKIIFKACLKHNKKMAGICRGGQFLNVMCGGSLWQDVNNHGMSTGHIAYDLDRNELVNVSSTHHQMMIPGEEGKVLLVAGMSTRREKCRKVNFHDKRPVSQYLAQKNFQYQKNNLVYTDEDVEAVIYPECKSLCFQPHPEFPDFDKCTDLYFIYLDQHLGLRKD